MALRTILDKMKTNSQGWYAVGVCEIDGCYKRAVWFQIRYNRKVRELCSGHLFGEEE